MIIGLDFDNTIVSYEKAISILSDGINELPDELSRNKLALRNFLRSENREREWTAFQGELYGPGMKYAVPFRGAVDVMQQLQERGHELIIISHRSRTPYAGQSYDLHKAAREWVAEHLQRTGLLGKPGEENRVHFLDSLKKKLAKVTELRCDIFVDDLIEVLTSPEFPSMTLPVLFDPNNSRVERLTMEPYRVTSWREIGDYVNEVTM